jgi:hypothetical protein
VNRFVSLPLGAPVVVAGKVRFSERLLRAIQCNFALSTFSRLLAAGYLRSVDPIALCAQRAFRLFRLRHAEYQAWEFRIYWRQRFEDKLCAMARGRTLASIDVVLTFYTDLGYLLPPRSKDVLYSRLMNALEEDTALGAEMATLQKMPIGVTALRRRILALDAGVERHMAALAHDMVMRPVACDGVVSGGVQ